MAVTNAEPNNRRKGRERFLLDDEIRRIGAVLSDHAARLPLAAAAAKWPKSTLFLSISV